MSPELALPEHPCGSSDRQIHTERRKTTKSGIEVVMLVV